MPPSNLPVRRAPVRLLIAVGLAVLALVAVSADADPGDGPPAPEPLPPSTSVAYAGPTAEPLGVTVARAVARARADELDRFYAWASTLPVPKPEPSPVATTDETSPPAETTGSGDPYAALAAHFGDVYDSAVGVARCESGLDPGAISDGGGNWGLLQVNVAHRKLVAAMGYRWEQLLDADVNARVARRIYDDAGGWGPWSCRWAA